jgi:hypothetical protein
MPEWMTQELDTIGNAGEIQLSTTRPDGSLGSSVPVWIVRLGNDLYVRSYRGQSGTWYRHARRHPIGHIRAAGINRDIKFNGPNGTSDREAIDDAYRSKYGDSGYTDTMVREDVAATTLRLTPVGTE